MIYTNQQVTVKLVVHVHFHTVRDSHFPLQKKVGEEKPKMFKTCSVKNN
jgi:hypothetical protein